MARPRAAIGTSSALSHIAPHWRHQFSKHQEKRIMSTKHFPGATHSTLLGLVGAAVLFCPARCHGESPRPSATRRACAVSYEKAQQLRQASKLRAAKEVLTSCAKSA